MYILTPGRCNQEWPSEFTVTGSLKTWSVVDELQHITAPTLVLNGRFDEARNLAVAPFFTHIRGPVKWVEFAESSHMPSTRSRSATSRSSQSSWPSRFRS
ncbi:unnamed protein product [Mycena citricolor]|uniref:Uncharacterized protein n=1 Tax=Mycena citricolor TaxID=2018698 RepID=A0AAD2K155_9AGAR|nr:unnamed protein product [Mycena citricolor]